MFQFCIGSLKSATSVGRKYKHSRVPTKEQKNFFSIRKGSPPIEPGSCMDYTSILIQKRLFFKLYF